jgi:3-oxoacyl-[acyl-carrier protein] reductase
MISVNSIAPGWVNTRMIQDSGEDFLKEVADVNPLKRIADPKDISNLVKFLLKPESEYINGQVITVDGGYTNQDPTLLLEEDTV